MATVQRKLVHKQFNSPIGLYSENNVKSTLNRELKAFSNGTMGVDCDDNAKPANLANSAVLKLLEEEEQQKQTGGIKRVTWPPEHEYQARAASQTRQSPALQPQTYQQQQQQQQHQYQQPAAVHQPLAQQQQYQTNQSVQPQPQKQYHPEDNFYRQPSPGTITLRKELPVTQRPPLIYASEPAAYSFGGGGNMRGDMKWPPEDVKRQSEIENEQRRQLALGPAFRPRRVNKDYSGFFQRHALNSTYPGYRAPPGTQHYGYQYPQYPQFNQ